MSHPSKLHVMCGAMLNLAVAAIPPQSAIVVCQRPPLTLRPTGYLHNVRHLRMLRAP